MSEKPENGASDESAPPILGTWGRFYAVVVANTLFVYLLLILFSAWARG